MKVSVVVPVYNERALIVDVLRKVSQAPFSKELVVVDDCSTDGTRTILEKLAADPAEVISADPRGQTELRVFFQPVNGGKGAALHRGFAEALGEVVVVQDADLEYDPAEIAALLQPIERGEADVVYGSRFLGGHAGFPFWHTLANRLLTWFSNTVTRWRVTDMETCYKVMRADVLRELPLNEKRFGFEPEVTAQLAHLSRRRPLRLVERPISYKPRSIAQGKKIRLKDAFRALYCTLRYGLTAPKRRAPAPQTVKSP
jgi:glycosyltransferase involved in cell wall biosynthesis